MRLWHSAAADRVGARLHRGCSVAEPSERIKTDQRDAINLAKLRRAGELTLAWFGFPTRRMRRSAIWCGRVMRLCGRCVKPASNCPASCCARATTTIGRPGRSCIGGGRPACASRIRCITSCWKTALAVEAATARRDRLEAHIEAVLPDWSLATVAHALQALQALRGMALVVAATLVAELGDITRFVNPR